MIKDIDIKCYSRRRGPALLTKKAAPTVQTDFTVKIGDQDFPCSKDVLKEIVKNPDIDLNSGDSVSLNINFDESIKLSENNKFKSSIKSILNGEPTFIYNNNLNTLIDHLKINNLVNKQTEQPDNDEMKWLVDIDNFFSGETVDLDNEGVIGNEEKSIDDETIIWLLVGKVISDHKNAEKYINIMLSYIKKRGELFQSNLKRVVINSLKNAVENGTEVKMIFELIFIIRRLYEANIVNEKDFDLDLGNRLLPATFVDVVETTNRAPFKVFNNNFEALSENKFDIHKQLCHNGVNPDDIYQLIRDDNVKEFDSITSSSTNSDNVEGEEEVSFDYNKENYMKSAYERCTYVNNDFMCYVDISAFFGSAKIFNYLINEKKARLTSKTAHNAIASGNKEIIELCEKNNLSFDGTLTDAIQFHRFELFKWLINDKKLSIDNCYDTLITTCLQFSSFQILNYLLNLPYERPESNLDINLMNIIEQSCKWGNFPVLRHILKNTLISRPFQGDNINAFHLACQNGNPDIVKFLCQQSFVELNRKVMTIIGSQGWCGLHFAASKGNTEAVRILINCKDIEINSTTSKNQTAIHLACQRSITETIKVLVDHPSSTLSIPTNSTNLLPLHISCQRGNSEAVKIIINSNKDYGGINALSAGDMTPLHLASIQGSGEVVKILCEVQGIDLNLKDFEKHNALQLSCIYNNVDCAKILSNQQGIDLKAVCKFDLSFIVNNPEQNDAYASVPGSPTASTPSASVPNSPIPDTNNNSESSNNQNGSFHFSCLKNSGRRGSTNTPYSQKSPLDDENKNYISNNQSCPPNGLIPFLNEPKNEVTERRPSMIDIDPEEEMNVLFYAAITKNLRLFQVLVSNPGIDINAVNKKQMSVLHICCQQGQIDFVRLILFRNDLDVNIKTNDGMTPLHFACREGHEDVVKALTNVKGIELNPTTNEEKLTPLHLACERGRTEVVKVLCATKGVDLTQKTGSGKTPVQIACQNGHSDVFAVLSQNDSGIKRIGHDPRKPQFGPQSLSSKGPGKISFGPSPKKGGIRFGPQ